MTRALVKTISLLALTALLVLGCAAPAAAIYDDVLFAPKEDGSAAEDEDGEAAEPMIPGAYEGEDGSVLTLEEDGTCAFETTVSGSINGVRTSARLTFRGAAEDGAFSFTRVMFYDLDLTSIAAALGYTDASLWESAAAAVYAQSTEG